MRYSIQLKADRLHPRNYLYMPTDYRHTDKQLRLVKRFSRERGHRQMDRRTDGRTDRRMDATKYIIFLALRTIIKWSKSDTISSCLGDLNCKHQIMSCPRKSLPQSINNFLFLMDMFDILLKSFEEGIYLKYSTVQV